MMKPKAKRPPKTNPVPVAPSPEPTREEVARVAYALWEVAGRLPGRDLEHWLLAESQLSTHSPSRGLAA